MPSITGNCPDADPTDQTPDDRELQSCLDRGSFVTIRAGQPGYIVRAGLHLRVSGTVLRSVGSEPALIVAHDDLRAPMLRVWEGTARWKIEGVTFDGRAPSRTSRHACAGYRDFESNLIVRGADFEMLHVSSVRAMCGSAIEVSGRNFSIHHNNVTANGLTEEEVPAGEPWADGITLLLCENGQVYENRLADNTDMDIGGGGGANCRIVDNQIQHQTRYGVGGLHVG